MCAGVSIPVDGGGLLTSWFNLDLQPRIAENGEDVVFGPDHTSPNGASNGNGAGKDDYPAVDSGARTVTASAVASVQTVQTRGSVHGRHMSVRRVSPSLARSPRMQLSAQRTLAFGA